MVDPRIEKAADILINYSTKIKEGEYVQIITSPPALALSLEVYKKAIQKGAYVTLKNSVPGSAEIYYNYASKKQLEHFPEISFEEIKKTDVYIVISAPANTRELANIDPKLISRRQKTLNKINEWRVKHTRWVLFDFPTHSLAQEADMSLSEFEDFVYGATNIDWENESLKLNKICNLVNKTDKVRIVSKDTDISFSVKGRRCVAGNGSHNMPDGEVFTSVVENSPRGRISFSYPTIYGSREVESIVLEFKDGKVIKATAKKNQDYLNAMLDQDRGARYIGEFGIGLNYNIQKHIKNILFDEKIGGTIHLAMGRSYEECKGKNKSVLHWDMICDLRDGGQMYFDDKQVYKNGKFL